MSDADVLVDSFSSLGSTSGLLAWLGTSERLLGLKVLDAGALPAGRVWALNSGAASLPTSTPGLCCES